MARSAICNCKGPVSWFDLGIISRFLGVRVCTKFLGRAQRWCSNRQARQQAAWLYACILLWMHRYSLRCLEQANWFKKAPGRGLLRQSSWPCHRCFYTVLYCFSYSLRYHQASRSYLAFHHSHICSGHRLCQVYSVDSIARLLLSSPGYS